MTSTSLADIFDRHFELRYADTPALRHASFRLRHQIYCEELGWEPLRPDRLETDEFDRYAFALLLWHKPTQQYAGTVRLVIPPPDAPERQLPFEIQFADTVRPEFRHLLDMERGTFSEISRISIAEGFRLRKSENTPPATPDELARLGCANHEEMEWIAQNSGAVLYLGIIAFSEICLHQALFAMMEVRLKKRLDRVGLYLEQVGVEVDHHGARALHVLTSDHYTAHLGDEMKALYQRIKTSLTRQTRMYPYIARPLAEADHA